jgi:hypothetical protein
MKAAKQTLATIFFLAIWPSVLFARDAFVDVDLQWKYEKFPGKIRVYSPTPERQNYISETGIRKNLSELPIVKDLNSKVLAAKESSTSAVLVIHNPTDRDLYFLAVPHEVHPAHSSTGHYFECLCIGRLFKVPAKQYWYRIVRINLDKNFSKLSRFKIEHKITGVSETEALGKYKDLLYEKD